MMPWASLGLWRNAALVFFNAHHPPPPERRVASLLPANRIGGSGAPDGLHDDACALPVTHAGAAKRTRPAGSETSGAGGGK